jgi:hypothetical protein
VAFTGNFFGAVGVLGLELELGVELELGLVGLFGSWFVEPEADAEAAASFVSLLNSTLSTRK